MPRFFVYDQPLDGGFLVLTGENAAHAKVLRLKSGDLLEVARVIKGLMWRDREKGLSNGERKMLHSAKQILVSEVVLVEGHTYPDAEQRIEQAMMTGAKNE